MPTVTKLNLFAFLSAARKNRPNEKKVSVDAKLVDAFFADVTRYENEVKGQLEEKDATIARLTRELAAATPQPETQHTIAS